MGESITTAIAGFAALGLIAIHSPTQAQAAQFDFGTDNGQFARDGECDDIRFQGEAMAEIVLTDEIGRDASDCSAALAAGTVSLNPLFLEPASDADVMFGDDTSEYARDGECDDIRFAHTGSGKTVYLAEDVGHDATDCKAGYDAGSLTWQGHRADLERGITAQDLQRAASEGRRPTT